MINYNYIILKLSIQNYYIYYYLIMHLRDNQDCLHLLSPKKGIHKSLLTLLCSHQQEQQRRQHQKQQEGSSCMFILLLWLPSAALLRHFSLSVCARRHSCPLSLTLSLALSLSLLGCTFQRFRLGFALALRTICRAHAMQTDGEIHKRNHIKYQADKQNGRIG